MKNCLSILKQRMPAMTPAEKRIAACILENPDMVINETITPLAKRAGTSSGSVANFDACGTGRVLPAHAAGAERCDNSRPASLLQVRFTSHKRRPGGGHFPQGAHNHNAGCSKNGKEPGNFTIVFAEELVVDAIKDAIRGAKTVAGNENKLYGDYRLVKYAYFLLENYYPAHDEKRGKLGAEMLRYASDSAGKDSKFIERLAAPRPSEMFAPLRWEK